MVLFYIIYHIKPHEPPLLPTHFPSLFLNNKHNQQIDCHKIYVKFNLSVTKLKIHFFKWIPPSPILPKKRPS